jgi:hypothetical protein
MGTPMFIDDDFWKLFASDGGAEGSLFWIVAPVLMVVALPAVILLGAIALDWFRPGRE